MTSTNIASALGRSADAAWSERGACRGADIDLFFSVDEEEQEEALSYCARCEIRQECLEYAVHNGEMYGVWGGTREPDRRSLIRDLRRREREARKHARRREDSAA